MPVATRRSRATALVAALALPLTAAGGCANPLTPPRPQVSAGFPSVGYSDFGPREPSYRMYPGDVLDVAFPSAPELNREVTVQPDGRISLPLVGTMMAADLSVPDLQAALSQAYGPLLVNPQVDVAVRTAMPLRVFVGGEVAKPGVYDMPGDIDALQAVVMAGGFSPLAKRREVILIRRGPGGQPLTRLVDLRGATYRAASSDSVPLRRFDVVYVPRTAIGDADLFVQQYIRDLVPMQFSYQLAGALYGVSP